MNNRVLHTVWCNISGEAAGEILGRSLLGVKGSETHEKFVLVQYLRAAEV